MTTALGDLVAAEPVLSRLAEIRLPAKSMYAIAKALAAVQTETALFHKQRRALIEELGTVREATAEEQAANGGHTQVFTVLAAQVPAFNARLQDIATVPVELDDKLRLPFAMLDGLEMSAHEFLGLRALVIEPNGEG